MASCFRSTRQLSILTLILGFTPHLSAWAESATPSDVAFPQMQVIGNRLNLNLLNDYQNSLMPVTGVTREQFKNQPDNGRLGDVINRLPGVFMGGAPGENKDIRLRGLDKEFTRFEFDGMQLPGGGEKREFQVNRISPFSIGEVKILRNPTAEYESDGIAGKVTADLRAIPEELTIDFKGNAGGIDSLDGDQRALSLAVGNRVNNQFGFNLFLDYNRFPLEKNKVKTKFDADGSLKEQESEQEDKPSDSYNALLDAAWFYDNGEVHFKPMWFDMDEEKEKSKLKTKPGSDPELETEIEDKNAKTWGGTLAQIHQFGNGVELESDISYIEGSEDKNKNKEKFKFSGGEFALDKTEVEDETKEDKFTQIRSKITVPFELFIPNTLKAGIHVRFRDRFRDKNKIEIKASDGSIKDKTEAKDDYQIQERYWAGFLQNELSLTQDLSWGMGLRVEHVEQKARSGDGLSQSTNFTDWNPSTHLRFNFTDSWTLHAAISRNLNRPKFDQLAPYEEEKDDRFVQGNPDLQPATAVNYDLGLNYVTDNIFLAVNLFHKDIKGVIEEVDTGKDQGGKDVFRVENVGDGWTRGIEFEQRLQMGFLHSSLRGLTLWANESILDSELTDRNGTTRPFDEQPELIANMGIEYQSLATGTTLNLTAKYRDKLEKLKDSGEQEQEKEQWYLDFSIHQSLAKNTSIFFNALNILDTEKEKSKLKTNGELELETESTGRVFMVGIESHF